MPDQVQPVVAKERSRLLRELGINKKRDFYQSFIGRRLPVLVEKGSRGTTPNYISVRIVDGSFRVGDEIVAEIGDVRKDEALGFVNPK
jgi:2-methylthioadenine synthetase